jgi:hypothetical protein
LSAAEKAHYRKEDEGGDWMEKKPPRKTPTSQDKGAVGSRGGVKRPHSDSSKPSFEKQQPKKPRNTQAQTGLYKEATTIQRLERFARS